jgi:Predicted membrane protein (DUF2127)
MKKMPDARPNIVAESCKCLLMSVLAMPRLIRSSYEITEKVTAFRAIALAINIAAVVWLLWSKRLFGLNGGAAAYHAEHNAATLLAAEQAALGPGDATPCAT